jgi:hypothetical protein
MKRSSVLSILAVLLCFTSLPVHGEEDSVSFVIAPPPVGYPRIVEGERIRQMGGDVLLLTMDLMDESLTIFGGSAFGNYQHSLTDSLAVSASLGGAFLAGDRYNLLMTRFPLLLNAIVQPVKTGNLSLFLFAGAGGDIALSSMTVTVPQFLPPSTLVNDDTTVSTLAVDGLLSAGAQLNINAGKFIVSPFGSWSYSGGSYSSTTTSSMSFTYPSTSGAIEGYSSTVYGFDILYTPKNISLSSQLRQTGDYTMISLAMKWFFKGGRM